MKQIQRCMAALLLSLAVNPLFAADGGLEAALRQVVEENLAAYNEEDLSRTLASTHSKSPAYDAMRESLPGQFRALNTRTELTRFSYIGHDDEFALARVQYRTLGTDNKPFMGNLLDTITIFHQEDGTWKFWDNYVIRVRLMN